MKDLRQILWNSLTSWGSVLIKIGFFFHMVPVLVKALGAEGFGVTGLVLVVVSFTLMADLGFRASLGRELSARRAEKDLEGFRGLSTGGLILFLGIAIPLALALVFASPWLVDFFQVPEELRGDTVLLLRTYGVMHLFTSFVRPVLAAGLSAFKRLDVVNNMETLRQLVLWVGLILGFLVFPPSENPLLRWGIVASVCEIAAYLVFYLAYRRVVYPGSLSFRNARKKALWPLFQLSGHMFALNLTYGLSERADPLIISRFLGPAGVALYQAGMKISSAVRPLVSLPAHQLFPYTTEAHVRGETKKQYGYLVYGTRYLFMIGSLICVLIYVYADIFCHLWLNEALGDETKTVARVMRLIAVSDYILFMSGTQWPVLLGIKKLSFLVKVQVPSALINVLASIYIIGYTEIGVEGVLYATIIVGLIRRPFIFAYTCSVVGVSKIEYFKKGYATVLISSMLTLGLFVYLSEDIKINGWLDFILSLPVTTLTALLILWAVGCNGTERHHIKNMVWNKRRGVQ